MKTTDATSTYAALLSYFIDRDIAFDVMRREKPGLTRSQFDVLWQRHIDYITPLPTKETA